MLSISSAQLADWIAGFFWPFMRVLGLVMGAPVLSNPAVPVSLRVVFSIAVTVAVAPLIPAMPAVDPSSAAGLLIAVQQLVIGLTMGFVMRLVFDAVEMAGSVAALQMGLGFATLLDPENSAQVPVLGQFYGLLAVLVFLAVDGHLMMFQALVAGFAALPIGAGFGDGSGFAAVARWGSVVFAAGLLLSLPLVGTLLATNMALGVITRAAPQLNLFAVGFPLTLSVGFVALLLTLPYLAPLMLGLFEQALGVMDALLAASGAP